MGRLREMVLRWLPVATNRALDGGAPQDGASPIKAVLRSKGFMWMSHSHTTAFYWSHAGQHFEIRDEGEWCGAVRCSGDVACFPSMLHRSLFQRPLSGPSPRHAFGWQAEHGAMRRWAAVPAEDWPESLAQRAVILGDFDRSSAFGDRRQARLLTATAVFAHMRAWVLAAERSATWLRFMKG